MKLKAAGQAIVRVMGLVMVTILSTSCTLTTQLYEDPMVGKMHRENRQSAMSSTTVRTLSGTTIMATIPDTIVASRSGDCLKWDFSVTFSCEGGTNTTIERIGRKYVDRRGGIWTSSSGEWHSEAIIVPTHGGIQYSSWVRQCDGDMDLRGGSVIVGFSGQNAKGSAFEGQVTARLAEGRSRPTSSSSEDDMPKAAVISIQESQRQILEDAKTWKVEVVYDLPHDPQKEDAIGLRKECEDVLKSGGFQIDDQTPTLVLRVRVFGVAKPESYYGTGRRYTGAEVTINATVDTADSPQKTFLTFSEGVGCVSPPQSISSGYLTPADAPYSEAYRNCRDFYTQLLSVVHTVKGAEAVYKFRSDQDMPVRDHVLAFIYASGDRSFVPLLANELLTGQGWRLDYVAACLGSFGDARAIEPLCISLVDKDGDVWEPAASALAKLGDVKAVPPLRTALLSVNSKPSSAASALRDLKWRPETTEEKVIYWLALDEPNKVKRMKAESVPVLIKLLDAEKWAAPAAAQLLGEMEEVRAVSSLSRTLLGSKSLNSWKGRSLRLAAAKALSEIGDPKVVEPLAMTLMSDDDNNVRKVCATGLGKVGGEQAVKCLTQTVLADNDSGVVIAAEDALGQLRARGSVECLLKSLNHKNSGVRTHAAHALKTIGDAKAAPALRNRLVTEKDDKARKAMAEALAGL